MIRRLTLAHLLLVAMLGVTAVATPRADAQNTVSVTVTNVVLGGTDDGFDFSFPGIDTNLANGQSTRFDVPVNNQFEFTDFGWDSYFQITNFACTGSKTAKKEVLSSGGRTPTNFAKFTVGAGTAAISCMVTHTPKSNTVAVSLTKRTVAPTGEQFRIFVSDRLDAVLLEMGDGETIRRRSVANASIEITETLPPGWSLISLTCSGAQVTSRNPEGSATIKSSSGAASCELTNERTPLIDLTITHRLQAPAQLNPPFQYTSGVFEPSGAPEVFNLRRAESLTVGVTRNRDITVFVTMPGTEQWQVDSVTCQGARTVRFSRGFEEIWDLELGLGSQDVSCQVVNSQKLGRRCAGRLATVDLSLGQTPTQFDDVIVGTPGPDVINALGGDDIVCGLGGDDQIFGGGFDDTLYGGPGNDMLVDDGGTNDMYGGPGNDTIQGGPAGNRIFAGLGNDVVRGGAGSDLVFGGGGDDQIFGNGGEDALYGMAGVDNIDGGAGSDAIFGGPSDDSISGGPGADKLHGRGGNDTIAGDGGDDQIFAGAGDDRAFGGQGTDRIWGGVGDDTLSGGDDRDVCYGMAGTDTVDCETAFGVP